jgi:hypothetical protein
LGTPELKRHVFNKKNYLEQVLKNRKSACSSPIDKAQLGLEIAELEIQLFQIIELAQLIRAQRCGLTTGYGLQLDFEKKNRITF